MAIKCNTIEDVQKMEKILNNIGYFYDNSNGLLENSMYEELVTGNYILTVPVYIKINKKSRSLLLNWLDYDYNIIKSNVLIRKLKFKKLYG